MKEEILKDEECFHDEWASEIDLDKVFVNESFELPTAPESSQIVRWLGDVSNKDLLDLGSGAGEAAVYFAKRGANVTATDLSGQMLKVVKQLATRHQTNLRCEKCSATELPFKDASFDIVHAANVLHHVNADQCIDEVIRVLKPGGCFVSWDPLIHNPVINVYRRIATDVRTEDEEPLNISFVTSLDDKFVNVKYKCFWLCTLLVFLKFFLIDRVHPNKERYWKKIIYDYNKCSKIYNPLFKLDNILLKNIPFLRKYCWNLTIICTKET